MYIYIKVLVAVKERNITGTPTTAIKALLTLLTCNAKYQLLKFWLQVQQKCQRNIDSSLC